MGTRACDAGTLVFFHYLSRHPQLIEEDVEEAFFPGERTHAWAGVALYTAAGVLGYLVAPPVALGIFLALPVFYAITSEGLYELTAVVRRPSLRKRQIMKRGTPRRRRPGYQSALVNFGFIANEVLTTHEVVKAVG